MAEYSGYPTVIKVPSNQKETLFNNEALTGAIIGNAVSDNHLGGTVAGGLIGGLIGKSRIEKENREGRPVYKPSTPLFAMAAFAVIGALTGVGIALALEAGAAMVASALGIGALAGATVGNASNKIARNDYQNAIRYYEATQPRVNSQEALLQSVGITAEEAQLLESRLAQAPNQKAEAYRAEKLVNPALAR